MPSKKDHKKSLRKKRRNRRRARVGFEKTYPSIDGEFIDNSTKGIPISKSGFNKNYRVGNKDKTLSDMPFQVQGNSEEVYVKNIEEIRNYKFMLAFFRKTKRKELKSLLNFRKSEELSKPLWIAKHKEVSELIDEYLKELSKPKKLSKWAKWKINKLRKGGKNGSNNGS